ncbi:MAG: hypothetical protein GWP05_08170 [Anaerolineaceae bacterium]|nr:hypothetical protein [Anaerolineaceae bacterium]
MSTDPRSSFRRVITVGAAAALVLAMGLPPLGTDTVGAQESPKPERKPKSVTLQVYVIMASKAAKPHADASLKELAGLLKGNFGKRFNHFTLHRLAKESIKLSKKRRIALAADYHLKAEYRDAKAAKIVLGWHLVRLVTSAGKTREVDVSGQNVATATRGKFFLIGGPQVGDKTMILAIRVIK